MKKEDLIKSMVVDKSPLVKAGFNPYYQPVRSGLGRNINVNGKSLISLGTNDYLGIANNEEIKKEALRALRKFGVSMCGTPIVVGQTAINRKLETEIASFLKQEDALIFPSCYQCNMGIFGLLTTGEDVIIADREIHSSLLNGIGLSKASFKIFSHNNLDKLEKALARYSNCRMKFIVVEGLYSTNGDVPPLDGMMKLAEKYEAFIIVDDAHGVGVLGREGRGVLEVFDAFKEIDLVTGSLGKGVGAFGGFLAGGARLIDYFRYNSPQYFYSTALPPAIAAASIISLRYIKEHPEIRERINSYARKLYQKLETLGFRLTKSTTPVVCVLFETAEDAILATKMLYEKGIYTVVFVPPSVAKGASRIRLTLNANLQSEDIDFVISVFSDIKKRKPQWVN